MSKHIGPTDNRKCAMRSAIRKLDTDRDGIVLYWNGRTRKYFEFDPKDCATEIDAARLLSKWGIKDG